MIGILFVNMLMHSIQIERVHEKTNQTYIVRFKYTYKKFTII